MRALFGSNLHLMSRFESRTLAALAAHTLAKGPGLCSGDLNVIVYTKLEMRISNRDVLARNSRMLYQRTLSLLAPLMLLLWERYVASEGKRPYLSSDRWASTVDSTTGTITIGIHIINSINEYLCY